MWTLTGMILILGITDYFYVALPALFIRYHTISYYGQPILLGTLDCTEPYIQLFISALQTLCDPMAIFKAR